jgi:hypothetical protein
MINYLFYYFNVVFLLLAAVAAVLAGLIVRANRKRLPTRWQRVCCFGLVFFSGAAVALTLLREPPRGFTLGQLANWNWDALLTGGLDMTHWLNVLLFVPPAFFGTMLWRHPVPVAAIGLGASVAIEAVQAVTEVGGNDVIDLVCNTLGAFAGAWIAAVVVALHDTAAGKGFPVGRLAGLLAAMAVAVAGTVGGSWLRSAQLQTAAAAQLDAAFTGTALSETDEWYEQLWDELPTGLSQSDYTTGHTDGRYQIRFDTSYLMATSCVTATWTADGYATVRGQGADCASLYPEGDD